MGKISEKIKKEIDLQISRENFNAQRYFYFESWLKDEGLDNIGEFFKTEAEGELGHAKRFRDYLNDRNVTVRQYPIMEVEDGYVSGVLDLAEKYLEAEQETTANITRIAELALSEGDLMTFQSMQWFLGEQVEEENVAQTFLDKARKIGDDSTALVLWDATFED